MEPTSEAGLEALQVQILGSWSARPSCPSEEGFLEPLSDGLPAVLRAAQPVPWVLDFSMMRSFLAAIAEYHQRVESRARVRLEHFLANNHRSRRRRETEAGRRPAGRSRHL